MRVQHKQVLWKIQGGKDIFSGWRNGNNEDGRNMVVRDKSFFYPGKFVVNWIKV